MGKIFDKGLDEDEDKKGGLFKKLEILKAKTKSCWMHLVQLIKLVRLLKIKWIIKTNKTFAA